MSKERNIYQDALDVQGAVNLSGVIFSLPEIANKVWEEIRSEGNQGTDAFNTHPVMRLIAEQFMWLSTHGEPIGDSYSKAFDICTEKAKQGKVEEVCNVEKQIQGK